MTKINNELYLSLHDSMKARLERERKREVSYMCEQVKTCYAKRRYYGVH